MVERLLVIDDSTTIQKVVQIAFAKLNIEVRIASSYIEAMNEVNEAVPNVVIADSSLPGIRGPEDYGNMRRQLSHTPFIILIGSYDGLNEESFRSFGFDHFLRKPFEASDLINCVELAIGHSLQQRTRPLTAEEMAPVDQVAGESMPGIPPPPPLRSAEPAISEAKPSVEADGFEAEKPAPQPFSIVLSELDEDLEEDDDTADEPSFELADRSLSQSRHTSIENDAQSEAAAGYSPAMQSSATTEQAWTNSDAASAFAEAESSQEQQGYQAGQSARTRSQAREDFDHWDDTDGFMPPPPPEEDDHQTAEDGGLASSAASTDQWSEDDEGLSEGAYAVTTTFAPRAPRALDDQDTEDPDAGIKTARNTDAAAKLAEEQAEGLIQPFLREELAQVVKSAVEDYCDRHFARLARELITEEIQKLLSSKSRLLIDK